MIKVIKDNVFTKVEHFDEDIEERALKASLTFQVPNFWFMKSYRNRVWDGRYSFYNAYSKKFPTGLIPILPEKLQRLLLIVDARKKPKAKFEDPTLIGIELRDYQVKAIQDAVAKERCILTAPTNAGKTECGASIMKVLRPLKVLWLTHRGNLMYQTRDRLAERLDEDIGVIHRDTFDTKRVTVGMVQTIYHRLRSKKMDVRKFFGNWLSHDVDVLMIDECHHQSAGSWKNVAKKCNAYYRIGLSATPLMREEIQNLWLVGLTGDEIKTVRNIDLIRRGISARPRIVRIKNWSMKFVQQSNYRLSYRFGIEENNDRNKTIAGLIRIHKGRGEPILVLINTIKHGKEILKRAPEGTIFLHGILDLDYRDEILNKFKQGEVPCIIATPIFDEGVDVPIVRAMVLGGAGASHLRLLQRVGRVMRKNPTGDNVVTVYDFEDQGDKYLSGHSTYRLQLYRKEGFDVIPTTIKFGARV